MLSKSSVNKKSETDVQNSLVCERCGACADKLYNFDYEDEEFNEKHTMKICWDCDHDIINGADPFEDASNIYQDRREQAYSYDPINEVRPY